MSQQDFGIGRVFGIGILAVATVIVGVLVVGSMRRGVDAKQEVERARSDVKAALKVHQETVESLRQTQAEALGLPGQLQQTR